MPYKNLDELPQKVRGQLPLNAQRIYVAAFNCAWEQYRTLENDQGPGSRAEMADRVAWDEVSRACRSDAVRCYSA